MLRIGQVLPPRHGAFVRAVVTIPVRSAHSTTESPSARATQQWRPSSTLDGWVERPIRPISLRQLFFFGRTLTESRLISAANYVRVELPTRLAHRLREMQKLPYVVVTNPHLSVVYDLYYKSFESFRRIPTIRTVEDNEKFCDVVSQNLKEHLAIIPNLIIGVLECQQLTAKDIMDHFANTMLRARISRRVIAEQHLAITDSFTAQRRSGKPSSNGDYVGNILLRCNAQDVIRRTGKLTQELCKGVAGADAIVPEINIRGHLDATFPYAIGQLEYILGELLRNSIQAVMDHHAGSKAPPPIDILVCESQHQVTIRISDQGGGVERDVLPFLWSFNKGPRSAARLENLGQVPLLAAKVQDIQISSDRGDPGLTDSSLETLTTRPPNLRLGMGLPMSRVYAEYWAGGLELHSLEGYGVDAFLQISKLGNQNEQVTSRASVDAV